MEATLAFLVPGDGCTTSYPYNHSFTFRDDSHVDVVKCVISAPKLQVELHRHIGEVCAIAFVVLV